MKLHGFVLLIFPRSFNVLMCVPAERTEKERGSGGDRKPLLNSFHGRTLLDRPPGFQRASLGESQIG